MNRRQSRALKVTVLIVGICVGLAGLFIVALHGIGLVAQLFLDWVAASLSSSWGNNTESYVAGMSEHAVVNLLWIAGGVAVAFLGAGIVSWAANEFRPRSFSRRPVSR